VEVKRFGQLTQQQVLLPPVVAKGLDPGIPF